MKALLAAALAMPLAGCFERADREVSAADYGDAWPFTVPSGKVNCFKTGTVLVFAPDPSVSYALNGGATLDGFPRIDPIWRDSDTIPGAKVSLAPIIEKAREAC